MIKPSILIAAGCSWVAGKGIDTDPAATVYDKEHVEDPEFVKQHSFAGLLQQQLGLDQLHFIAQHGASNNNQLRRLIAYIDQHQDEYSKIFVLWGITSIYRWEMFSSSTDTVEDIAHGRDPHNEEIEKEIKYYFSHFWNKEYELEKLGNQVVMLNGYLHNLGIQHLFFNSFQSYDNKDLKINNVDDLEFYRVEEKNNDTVSFLCRKNNIKITSSKVPFLNLLRPREIQFNSSSVKELQQAGLLDQATAHPTIKAHQLIANELYDYIKEKNNERI